VIISLAKLRITAAKDDADIGPGVTQLKAAENWDTFLSVGKRGRHCAIRKVIG
jgi:hypothetical protein